MRSSDWSADVCSSDLGGGAQIYGLTLGAFGLGAVAGALNIAKIRGHLDGEWAVGACAVVMAVSIAIVALSGSVILTALQLAAGGAAWMISITLLTIGTKLSMLRWVAGRALAA